MSMSEDYEFLPGTVRMFVVSASGVRQDSQLALSPSPTTSPNDPLNWPLWRKAWHSLLVLFITGFTAAIANDAGSAGDAINDDLGIPYSVQNTAAGVLFIGIGYSTLLFSPMTRLLGRRIQYFVCLLFALGGSVWFARVQTRADTILSQLFVGISESCAEALVQQSLSDLFFQHQRGSVLGVYILATSIGTFLGPLVGGYIADDDWRWIGWSAAIIAGASLLVFYFTLEETAFPREFILGRNLGDSAPIVTRDDKAEGLRAAPATEDPTAHFDVQGWDEKKSYWQTIAMVTPAPNMLGSGTKQYFQQLLHILRVFGLPAVVYSGLMWGAQDAWLSFYLTVEEDYWINPPYNYSNAAVSIMNVPTLIGAIIGCIYGGWLSDVFVRWMARRRGGISEAEDRLWLVLLSALANPAGLFLFGIGSDKGFAWPAPYVGLGLIGFGWGCAGDLSMAYLMDCYPDIVLEGMVGVAVINNSLACIFTFVASIWIEASGLGNTFIAIGCLSLAFHLTTVPMIIWGKDARRWTLGSYKRFLWVRDGL